MDNLLNILGEYEVFTNFIPGVIFYKLSNPDIQSFVDDDNLLVFFIMCYFIGLVINRIGSLILEPIFMKCKLIEYVDYEKYIKVGEETQKYKKTEALMKINNLFRTLSAEFTLLFLIYLIYLPTNIKSSYIAIGYNELLHELLFAIFAIIFILSYRKQTKYIRKRIEFEYERNKEKNY